MAWLYKQRGSDNWWMGWRVGGRQFLKSTGETDRKKAEQKLHEVEHIRQAKEAGKLTEQFIESLTETPTAPKITFKAALDDWLAESKAATAPSTAEKYKQVADEFSGFIKASDHAPLLRDVSSDVIRAFLIKKRLSTTASTTNVSRTILATFFIRALKNGQIRQNPVLVVRTAKAGKDEVLKRQAFTLEQMKTIYSKAPDDFWRYMILGGYSTGLRLGDLATMPWGAVDFTANTINILTRKTKKRVQIPITVSFRALLLKLHCKGPHKPAECIWPEQAAKYEKLKAGVFSSDFYENILIPSGLAGERSHQKTKQGRSAKREFTGLSFHSLRHTYITMLKATGATGAVAKELVGHSSDSINDLYTHLPLETLAHAVKQLPEVTG